MAAVPSFRERLMLLSKEFGSRYALAKSSGVPASTLQSYEAGSKPGLDALIRLARTANVDLNWLVAGTGEMRAAGTQPGALLKDLMWVDQYKLGTALSLEVVIGQVPFSRNFLESRLRLNEPTPQTLMTLEAGSNLLQIVRGDIVLVDREQSNLGRDGIYLFDFPGLELRKVFRHADERVRITGPEEPMPSETQSQLRAASPANFHEVSISELLDPGRSAGLKIIGRVVWLGRSV